MGKLEESYKKRRRRADLQRLILQSAAVAGGVAVALIAPNVFGALGKLGMLPTKRQGDSIRTARNALVYKGLLIYERDHLRLTDAGEKRLRLMELRDYKLPHPKRWDKRWRVLIFDIPERRKAIRNRLREILAVAGFVRLQDSVWVFPYDCEDFVMLLKAEFKIGKDVLYMIVDTVENDGHLRKKFALH